MIHAQWILSILGAGMRAKFVVDIRGTSENSFPSNEEFEAQLLGLGLGEQGRSAEWDLRLKKYFDEADKVWDHFPR